MTGNLTFSGFELRPTERVLMVNGQAAKIGARAFDVLAHLAVNRERVVGKDELLGQVWPGVAVEDGNLTVQISALRKLLGKGVITTVTGNGYRFTSPNEGTRHNAKTHSPVLAGKPSLAVLPFANLSGDPSQDYFVDGVVGDIINGLSRVRAFFVIAQSSSFIFKGRNVTVSDVGQDLGVRYVLEGSFQQAGKMLRVSTQLVEAATGHTIWSARFDGARDDVFALQDDITEKVVAAIEPNLVLAEIERAQTKPTDNLMAYDLCQKALPHVYNCSTLEEFDEAIRLLGLAIAADPHYSFAKAAYGWAHTMAAANRLISHDQAMTALPYVLEALENHKDDPVTQAYSGHSAAFINNLFDPATEELERALLLNPNSTVVLRSAGWVAHYVGNAEQAIEYFNQSMRLNPLDPQIALDLCGVGYALMTMRKYAEAEDYLRRSLASNSGFQTTLRGLLLCYFKSGQTEKMNEIAERLREEQPNMTISLFLDSYPNKQLGHLRMSMCDTLRAAGFPEA